MELIMQGQEIGIVWCDEYCKQDKYYMDGTIVEINNDDESLIIDYGGDLVSIEFSYIEKMTIYFK